MSDCGRYEYAYAKAILAFEREQVRRKLRPPLPCDQGRIPVQRTDANKRAIDEREQKRAEMFRLLYDCIGDGEAVSSPLIAERIGQPARSISSFLDMMVKDEILFKLPKIRGDAPWVYVKTGKKLSELRANKEEK